MTYCDELEDKLVRLTNNVDILKRAIEIQAGEDINQILNKEEEDGEKSNARPKIKEQ